MTEKKTKSAAKKSSAQKATKQQEASIVIDGNEYLISALSDRAKAQIVNLRATDERAEQLQQELMIVQTARQAYANALKTELAADNGKDAEVTIQ